MLFIRKHHFSNKFEFSVCHIQFVKDTCLFQQNLQLKNIEQFLSFAFDITTIRWNYVSKCKNVAI